MLGPQNGHELGGRERRAAEREEIAVGVDRDRAELLAPADGELALVWRQVGVTGPIGLGPAPRRRPRQRLPIYLARGRDRQLVEHDDQRHQTGRHPLGGDGPDVLGVNVSGDVADEQFVAGGRLTHDRARAVHARDRAEHTVDLAELDPATANLDLVVAAPDELESMIGLTNDVAGAVGPVPPIAGRRR